MFRFAVASMLLAMTLIGLPADEPKSPSTDEKAQRDFALRTSLSFQGRKYHGGTTEEEKNEVKLRNMAPNEMPASFKKKFAPLFPFESLEPRLAFDAAGRKRVDKTLPTAKPAKLVAESLDQIEGQIRSDAQRERTIALAQLHDRSASDFVEAQGFGVARFVPLPRRVSIAVQPREKPDPKWSEADRGEAMKLTDDESWFMIEGDEERTPTNPGKRALSTFHAATAYEFARPDDWGLVVSKKEVAGFRGHQLADTPQREERTRTVAGQKKPTERWVVRKLDLIGLLMHDEPVAYVTEGLPSMKAAKDAQTRELETFEKDALKTLAGGEATVVTESTTNHIRMVGAIRMAEACLKCHEGKRGDLLGAFSYDLVRDPAFVAKEK